MKIIDNLIRTLHRAKIIHERLLKNKDKYDQEIFYKLDKRLEEIIKNYNIVIRKYDIDEAKFLQELPEYENMISNSLKELVYIKNTYKI
ncbi:MAG: hypothetical protein BAJALOKI3v1_50042 [Promethearchaeota archaeon]|nr:MAG: hypothetical protein BAJALOKI3v1_50042 [Candidatus Lokiarchaeota archaeon]